MKSVKTHEERGDERPSVECKKEEAKGNSFPVHESRPRGAHPLDN